MTAKQKTAALVAPAGATGTSVIARLAGKFGVDPAKMVDCLKATAFKADTPVTNEQLMALCVVADQYGLNPWTKEIYAFPDKKSGGIIPIVGVDGWARMINDNPQFDGMTFEQDDEKCACTIYRKDRKVPTTVIEYLAECKRNTGPWGTCPKRMNRHKAMIQCARVAMGYTGIKDPDEAEAIANAIDVTPREPFKMPTPAAIEAPEAETAQTFDEANGLTEDADQGELNL